MKRTNKSYLARKRRQARVRKHINGTSERPRLNVFRSLNHIYAQVIDDSNGVTLASASTIDSALRASGALNGKSRIEQSAEVGKIVAQRALDAGVKEVVFDRGGFKYHGRVKALAEASREAGLKF
jgi:large subunit ribosomal protein L18